MRLHRLTLRHFRGVPEREVRFDSSGITVVVGDNETGKSSLLEALGLLFELRDDSKAARLRAVQPAGRDVATEVEAEVTIGTGRLYYRKRWFRQRATELRIEPGGATWIGREAHDEAARRFADQVDPTLWAALAVTQEDSLVVPAAGTLTSVLTALDELAGGEVDHGAAAPLVSAVEREYLRYFTPTGRPTGEFAELARRRDERRTQASEAENHLAVVEQDVTRVESLRRDLVAAGARVDEQARRVAELEARRYAAAELITRVERLRRDVEVTTERRVALCADAERRRQLVADVDQREEACGAAVETAREAADALRAAERDLDERTAVVRSEHDNLAAARSTVRRLDEHLARLRDTADLADLTSRLAGIETAAQEERRLAEELARSPVDDGAVDAAEAAHLQVLAARAAQAAGSPTLVLRRLGPGDVEVAGSSFTERESTLVLDRDTIVEVAGVVQLSVQPGAGAAELALTCARAEQAERELLAELGARDLAGVRRAARARAETARALAAAKDTLLRQLDGAKQQDLIARRDLLAARLASAPDPSGPGDTQTPTDASGAFVLFDAAGAAAVDLPAAAEDVRAALRRAREDESTAARLAAEASAQETLARKQFEAASGAATAARVRAEQEHERRDETDAALRSARAVQTDEALAEAVMSIDHDLSALTRDLERADDEVRAAGVDRLEERLVEAASKRSELADQVEKLRDELRRIEGRLEMAGLQGLASAVEQARADLTHTQARYEIVERKATAAARLRDTLARHRAEARRRYAAPLRDRIESLGRTVFGPSFGVVLGDDLDVQARMIDGVALPVSSLSTGAREQLATIVRLAVAGLTAADGSGVPVVLDDALGWSDPTRLAAMGSLLAKAGESGQVILLTCVPDRYLSWVPDATVVRV